MLSLSRVFVPQIGFDPTGPVSTADRAGSAGAAIHTPSAPLDVPFPHGAPAFLIEPLVTDLIGTKRFSLPAAGSGP